MSEIENEREQSIKAGGINELGLIDTFFNMGFTIIKCLLELFANSIDAKAKNIKIYSDQSNTYLLDDGIGMNETKFKNMLTAFGNKEINSDKMGIFGIGSNASLINLCGKDKSCLIISKQNENILYCNIDYKQIFEDERYTDSVTINLFENYDKNSDDEIKSIVIKGIDNYLSNYKTGTIIVLPFIKGIEEEMEKGNNDPNNNVGSETGIEREYFKNCEVCDD